MKNVQQLHNTTNKVYKLYVFKFWNLQSLELP